MAGFRCSAALHEGEEYESAARLATRCAPVRQLRALGQRSARHRFNRRDIGAVDRTVDRHVIAERPRARVLAGERLRLADVGRIDGAVSVHVAKQHAHRNSEVADVSAARITHADECNVDELGVLNVADVDRVLVWSRACLLYTSDAADE